MTPFLLAAAALAAAALLLLLRPWWWRTAARRNADADSRRALNAAIYKDQLAELERDRRAGQLAEADYADARDELQRRLLADTADGAETVVAAGGRATWIVLLLALPLAAAGIYSLIGKPEAVLSVEAQNARATASMESLVAKLEQKLAAQPDNPEGWAMLGRSYGAMGRWDDAVKAFERIGPAIDQQPDLLAAFAELLLQRSQGDFAGRPRELIAKALARNPEHPHALLLAGTDAMQGGRPELAVKTWERLLKQLEPGSEDADLVQSAIENAKSQMSPAARGNKGREKLGAGDTAKKAGVETIEGTVELAPSLRGKVGANDTVFIFVRAVDGPRMPLAALRARAGELPLAFSLGDAQSLGGAKLSAAGDVRVEAKVSKSGNATAASGDLIGQSAIVKPGARKLKVLIDREVP